MRMRKAAMNLIKENKVKLIGKSESMGLQFQVDKEIVRIFQKPGRTLCTCSCYNGTKFCNSPTLCKHKLAAIIIWMAKE